MPLSITLNEEIVLMFSKFSVWGRSPRFICTWIFRSFFGNVDCCKLIMELTTHSSKGKSTSSEVKSTVSTRFFTGTSIVIVGGFMGCKIRNYHRKYCLTLRCASFIAVVNALFMFVRKWHHRLIYDYNLSAIAVTSCLTSSSFCNNCSSVAKGSSFPSVQ